MTTYLTNYPGPNHRAKSKMCIQFMAFVSNFYLHCALDQPTVCARAPSYISAALLRIISDFTKKDYHIHLLIKLIEFEFSTEDTCWGLAHVLVTSMIFLSPFISCKWRYFGYCTVPKSHKREPNTLAYTSVNSIPNQGISRYFSLISCCPLDDPQ